MANTKLPFVHLPLRPPSRQDAETDEQFERSQNTLHMNRALLSSQFRSLVLVWAADVTDVRKIKPLLESELYTPRNLLTQSSDMGG